MARFIYEFEGVRGRNLKLYDTKIIITTKKTVGSLITGNFTDGEKTIFLRDVVGVQFKKSGGLIGYLQFETPSMQMNNKSDNMFSENTFTYEDGKNGITNKMMEDVYSFVVDRIEELKYNATIIDSVPNFEQMKTYTSADTRKEEIYEGEYSEGVSEETLDEEDYIDTECPNCGEPLSFFASEQSPICPWCNTKINLK